MNENERVHLLFEKNKIECCILNSNPNDASETKDITLKDARKIITGFSFLEATLPVPASEIETTNKVREIIAHFNKG